MSALPIKEIAAVVGEKYIRDDVCTVAAYASDNSRLYYPPDAVVFPADEKEIAAVVLLANKKRFSIIPRGRATATTGAGLAVGGGLILSTERMTRVSEVDGNFLVAQAGALNGEVQAVAAKHGLFWPPDPSSRAYCTVGGNIATAAAGPRHYKYGGTRHHILSLRVITGGGELMTLGAKTTKYAVGYDLSRLIIGSEGTLAIVAEATLNLLPSPKNRAGVVAQFRSLSEAAKTVVALNRLPSPPAAVEIMDGGALKVLRQHNRLPQITADADSLLMIEVDESPLEDALVATVKCCEKTATATIVRDESVWAARRELSQLLRSIAPIKISGDVVVPQSRLAVFLRGVDDIAKRNSVVNVNFGHASDGNVHINFFANDEKEKARAFLALSETASLAVSLHGAISGEHGIGMSKRDEVKKQLSPALIKIMRDIKRVFDPNGVLNPQKIFPPDESS